MEKAYFVHSLKNVWNQEQANGLPTLNWKSLQANLAVIN